MTPISKPRPFVNLFGFKKDRIDVFNKFFDSAKGLPCCCIYYYQTVIRLGAVLGHQTQVLLYSAAIDLRNPKDALKVIDKIMSNENFIEWIRLE